MGTGDDDDRDDEDRRAILSRRSRLIALALSGLTTAATAGCYDDHGRRDDGGVEVDSGVPLPCLSPPLMDAGAPVPCLGAPLEDAGPTPCLEPPADAGPAPSEQDAGTSDAGSPDAAPVPCLTIPVP